MLAPTQRAIFLCDWAHSRDVSTLFRVLPRHYVAFVEMMRFQLTTRSEFERLTATDPETLTDLERAARFLYLQRTCFGGKPSGRNFAVEMERPARFEVTRLVPMLEGLHGRLTGVVIENLPFGQFIDRYDRPEIRELFGRFKIQPVKTNYTVSAKSNSTAVLELIITNTGTLNRRRMRC